MSTIVHRGPQLTASLKENYVLSEQDDGLISQVVIRYDCIVNPRSLIPAVGFPPPAGLPSSTIYGSHGRTAYRISRERANRFTADITYQRQLPVAAAGTFDLPPIREAWQGGYDQSHLSINSQWAVDPDVVLAWLGVPETNGVSDPFGQPTVSPTKNFQHFLSATLVFTRTSYSFSRPDLTDAITWKIMYRNRPPSQSSGDNNRWLKVQPSCDHIQNKGWYEIVETWIYSPKPNGIWDADVYPNSDNP